ncbi:cyclic pyranopterin monophosphate synthase MoaC [Qipengyuania psychrotolerans]|uniref:Cyclic pyranopterin monophosphate synthase n=1 Tax=Qipengyuania psychrotolerans TaxID=2867238 RepID=A0ABX8ZH15_9SPHN|nr:cyclic pyranopterin monophosphate synthase MoaC [Qipengyuania psychrotolerans]QZD88209.1 cyclic pyranopterin monophosphate synthase MoaC [Qipengyuania psychrotolerans]
MTRLTHLDESGAARMVDVSTKPETERSATAEGRIVMSQEALEALSSGGNPKGDAVAAARIAGILAAKRTGELIPLCHPLGLDSMVVDIEIEERAIRVQATARLVGKTGIEMEALTAVSVALLTLYDMGKAIDKGMRIEGIRLLEKVGGKSGHWRAQD